MATLSNDPVTLALMAAHAERERAQVKLQCLFGNTADADRVWKCVERFGCEGFWPFEQFRDRALALAKRGVARDAIIADLGEGASAGRSGAQSPRQYWSTKDDFAHEANVDPSLLA
jgi:hypothetical protein